MTASKSPDNRRPARLACPAGECLEVAVYRIDAKKCKGCTLCAKKCPANAILGTAKAAHWILPEKCVGCGTCFNVCRMRTVKQAIA